MGLILLPLPLDVPVFGLSGDLTAGPVCLK